MPRPKHYDSPEYAALRNRCLSILVRAPEDGYKTSEVMLLLYGKVHRQTIFEHLISTIDSIPIWIDDGRIGILNRRKKYLPLPLKTVAQYLSV